MIIDLGFDTSAAFHHYALEWNPGGMRWFVDDELVFAREGELAPCAAPSDEVLPE